MAKVVPRNSTTQQLLPSVFQSCLTLTLTGHQNLAQRKKYEAYKEADFSLQFFGVCLCISVAILLGYILRAFYFTARSQLSLSFLLVSVVLFSLGGVVLLVSKTVEVGSTGNSVGKKVAVVWIFGINACMCLAFMVMLHNHQCLLSGPDDHQCDYRTMRKVPETLMLTMVVTPQVLSIVLKTVPNEVLFLSWLVNAIFILICIIHYEATNSLAPYLTALPVSLLALHENQRLNLELFLSKERETEAVISNKPANSDGNELRHLVGNVAHDLKTPLSSLNMGIDVVTGYLEEFAAFAATEMTSSGAASCRATVDDYIKSINESVTNMKNVNVFMLMTINRCMDYTKASTGVKLVPKMETVDFKETISLPVSIMNDLQDKRTAIRLLPLPQEICAYVMTDKQWLQENIMCLLSNALKYSSKGVVTIAVSLVDSYSECVTADDPGSPPASGMQRAISNLKLKPTAAGKRLHTAPKDSPVSGRSSEILASTSQTAGISTSSHTGGSSDHNPIGISLKPSAAGGCDDSKMVTSIPVVAAHETANLKTNNQPQDAAPSLGLVSPRMSFKDAMEARKRTLQATALQSNTFIRVEIEDTGIGLSETAMANLFSPFNQAQRLAGGTGLGLFSLSNRVNALHGKYGVMKRRDGKQGSLFWFEIPYRPDIEYRSDSFHDLSVVIRNVPSTRIAAPADTHSRSIRSSSDNSGSGTGTTSRRLHSTRRTSKYEIKRSPSNHNASPVVNDLELIHSNIALTHQQQANSSPPPASIANAAVVAPAASNSKRICTTPLTKAVLSGKQLNILLADDSVSIQKMTCMLLKKLGHTVTVAENGAEALELVEAGYREQLAAFKYRQQADAGLSGDITVLADLTSAPSTGDVSKTVGAAPFDIVLMDFQMPIMDGLEATKRIRELETELMAQYKADGGRGATSTRLLSTKAASVGFDAASHLQSGDKYKVETEVDEEQPQLLSPPVFELQLYHQFIIGLSANSDDETIQIALDLGIDQFMPKPFTVANFKEVVDIYTLYYRYEDSGKHDDDVDEKN